MTPVALALAAIFTAGCQGQASSGPVDAAGQPANAGDTGSAGGMGLSAPQRLLQSRAVDRTRLRPDVTLADGRRVTMRRIDATTWSGTVQVAPGSDVSLEVVWVSEQRQGDLPLARLRESVAVGPGGGVFDATGTDYDYALDEDRDGMLNLTELEAGTDPFSAPGLAPIPDGDGLGEPITPSPDTVAPPVTAPPITVPPAAVPPVTVPPVTAPPTTAPSATAPPVVVPPAILPPLTVPPVAEPPVVAPPAAGVFVPRIARSDAPRIDGRGVRLDDNGALLDEWAAAVQVDAGGAPLGIDTLMIDRGAEAPSGTPWRTWGAMHDGEYLYVVVVVEDDGQRLADSSSFDQDDSLELFLDGDGSRRGAYVDSNDYHLIVPLLEPGTQALQKRPNANGIAGYRDGPASTGRGIVLDFVTGPGIGPDGLRRARFERDVYELRIALDSVDVRPGRPFGFELQVNDDDDGGARDGKWGWAHPPRDGRDVDGTVTDPSLMGTLLLD